MPETTVDPFSRLSLRRALKQWSNLVELGKHPLTSLRIVQQRHQAACREERERAYGLTLHQVLREAIEALRPEEAEPDYTDKRWRPHLLLLQEYVYGRTPEYVANQLGELPDRTYQESHADALDKLASLLYEWEQQAQGVESD